MHLTLKQDEFLNSVFGHLSKWGDIPIILGDFNTATDKYLYRCNPSNMDSKQSKVLKNISVENWAY